MLEHVFLENLFSSVLQMSLTASYVIIFVLIARFCMKRLPKIYSYVLWSVVLFRLLCPYSIESSFSLVPTYRESFSDTTGIVVENAPSHDKQEEQILTPIESTDEYVEVSVSWTIVDATVKYFKYIWILGATIILGFNCVSIVKLKSKLKDKTHLYDNIYTSERIGTAFVLGIFKPTIYLPNNLEPHEQEFILLHEQTHINRRDNITCLVGFIAVALHWFNPLVWVAYTLANKDMEMSCDESVIKKLGCKKEYSRSLLSFAVGRKLVSPLAFSEGSVNDTKQRINNIVSYKQPTLVIGVFAICLVAFIVIGFGLDSEISLTDSNGITLTDYGTHVKDYNLHISTADGTTLDDAKITVSMSNNYLAGIIPSTGDFNSNNNISPITINSAGTYQCSVDDIRDSHDKGYQLNIVISMDTPFNITSPNMVEPIYTNFGTSISTNAETLGFDIDDSDFYITIDKERGWANISDYETVYVDQSHLEITTKQIDDVTREIITYNTITGETSVLSVSSPPGFEIPV